MKKPITRARSTSKTTEAKPVATKNVTQKSIQKPGAFSGKTVPEKLAKQSTSVATSPKLSAKKAVAAKTAVSKTVSKTPAKSPVAKKPAVAAPSKPKTTESEKSTALKATKKRAPKDLATQYGEVVKAARTPVAKAAPRKRRNAAARAKLQAVIAPDDGLLQRLARAGAISSSHVADSDDADEAPSRTPVKRRSRKWETRCGKCGVSAQYTSSAALCIKCGAILVRD